SAPHPRRTHPSQTRRHLPHLLCVSSASQRLCGESQILFSASASSTSSLRAEQRPLTPASLPPALRAPPQGRPTPLKPRRHSPHLLCVSSRLSVSAVNPKPSSPRVPPRPPPSSLNNVRDKLNPEAGTSSCILERSNGPLSPYLSRCLPPPY